MSEATPAGAESTPTDVDGAASIIEGLLSKEETKDIETTAEPVEKQTESTEEATPQETSPVETEKTADAAEVKLESIDELATATGLPLETILNLKARTQVDGQERSVPLSEIVKGYQLESHFTKKSMELAEQRKAFEVEREQRLQEIQGRIVEVGTLVQTLEKNIIGDFEKVDWIKLRAESPAEYAALKQDFAERQNNVQQLKAKGLSEIQRINKEQEGKFLEQRQKMLKEESERLMENIPEWREPAKKTAEHKELWDYLKGYNFSDDDINNVIDHRNLVIARKAMLYDKMKKGVTETSKKVVKLPTVLKPGSLRPKQDADREKFATGLKNLKKSGHINDASKLIESMLKE